MGDIAVNSRKEKGIIRFDFMQDVENMSTYYIKMVYKDAEAISNYKETHHFARFIDFNNQENSVISLENKILKGV